MQRKMEMEQMERMELTSDGVAFELGTPIAYIEGSVLTPEERNVLAERIEKVILERKRIGQERRMQARLRQLQSIERARERYHALVEA